MIPDLRFISLPKKKPSFESIKSFLVSEGTKRIHFATSHKGALKPGKDARHGIFQVPFYDTIGHILSQHLEGGIGNYIFKSTFDGYWRGFKSKDDHDRCKDFVREYQSNTAL